MLYRLLSLCLAACLASPLAQADDLTTAKTNDIKQLIDVTGGGNVSRQFAGAASRQIFFLLKQSRPETPDRIHGVVERELQSLFAQKVSAPGGFLEQMIPIYAKHYTHGEIKDLLRFYQSPLGKKTLATQPTIAGEGLQLSQKWVQSIGPDIDKRVTDALKKEGITPNAPASAPAAAPAPAK